MTLILKVYFFIKEFMFWKKVSKGFKRIDNSPHTTMILTIAVSEISKKCEHLCKSFFYGHP